MQTDSTFEKWLDCISISENIIPVQKGIDPDHSSILSRIPRFQEKTVVDVISLMAQEVKSPLGIINLSVEILKTHPPAIDSVIYLDIIARNAHRIDNMINELLLIRGVHSHPDEKYSIQHLLGTNALSKT